MTHEISREFEEIYRKKYEKYINWMKHQKQRKKVTIVFSKTNDQEQVELIKEQEDLIPETIESIKLSKDKKYNELFLSLIVNQFLSDFYTPDLAIEDSSWIGEISYDENYKSWPSKIILNLEEIKQSYPEVLPNTFSLYQTKKEKNNIKQKKKVN